MPKGVEHLTCGIFVIDAWSVCGSLMPKGVEHGQIQSFFCSARGFVDL